jgi:hypothetical protein
VPLKNRSLAFGFVASLILSGCGRSSLKLDHVCFLSTRNDGESIARCIYRNGAERDLPASALDGYTAFSPEDAQILQAFVLRCERAGVKP